MTSFQKVLLKIFIFYIFQRQNTIQKIEKGKFKIKFP